MSNAANQALALLDHLRIASCAYIILRDDDLLRFAVKGSVCWKNDCGMRPFLPFRCVA
jgi:hypothetical protein